MMRAQFVAMPGRFATVAARATNIVIRTLYRLWDWHARRATVSILHGLDDRTLKDIGISRAEITPLVYGDRGNGGRRIYEEPWRCLGGRF
jgi:uncharacterized protein YjiS (DUF1127 family)